MTCFPLLADLGDLIGPAMACIFFVIWIASQVMANRPQGAPQRRPPAPAPAAGGPGPARVPPRDAPDEEALADEIERFLNRAGRQQVDPDVEIFEAEPVDFPKQPGEPLEAVLVTEDEPRRLVPRGTRIEPMVVTRSEPLAKRLDPLSGHESQLGGLQQHMAMQSGLSHSLGSLGDTSLGLASSLPDEMTGLPKTAAAGLAVLLRDQQSLRTAIVLSEIIERPVSRWV